METVKTRSGEDLHLSLDGLLGSPHDRILYMYLCQAGLEAMYNLIAEIYKYTRLRDEAQRQEQAELIVKTFLEKPDVAALGDVDIASLGPLLKAVESRTCTLDMWAELDSRLKACIEWGDFFKADMFGDFCNAIRERRPLSLTDLIGDCNAVRLRYLETWLREFHPQSVGNLLFWVDVQTTFMPLVGTPTPSNVFSIALFEDIQVAVRRIFNIYLADTSGNACVVSDETKKDVLARILMYQGEPFSPPRYASLFKAAQDQVVKWLQAKVFPNFQNSLHCIQCIVELEWLDLHPLAHKAFAPSRKEAKPTAVVLPLPSPDVAPSYSVDTTISKTEYTVVFPTDALLDLHVCVFAVVRAPPATAATTFYATVGDAKFQCEYQLFCGADEAHEDVKQFCYIPGRLPVQVHPRSNRHVPEKAPAPLVHAFACPTPSGVRYGLCFTTWTCDTSNAAQLLYLPTYTCFLTSTSYWHLRSYLEEALPSLRALPLAAQEASLWVKVVEDCHRMYHESHQAQHVLALRPPLRVFTLNMQLPPAQANDAVPSRLFSDLNVQNIVLAMTALLVEHRVIFVAKHRDALFLGAESLLRLLAPFRWKHTYLPFCPANVAAQLKGDAPCFVGLEAAVHLKRADTYTHRIRSSICNLQRAHVVLKTPDGSFTYASELYATRTVIVDLDHDEVYTPMKQDLPELPLTKVRALELAVRAVQHPHLAHADHFLFQPEVALGNVCNGAIEAKSVPHVQPADAICLCFVEFLHSLFGTTTQYFSTVPNTIDLGKNRPALTHPRRRPSADGLEFYAQFLVFDIEDFLAANMEMGCREFFRQVFVTEAFHDFLMRQRLRFVSAPAMSS
ncbi:hypothetical protein ACHHYP_17055 [Achlya hypogyna]|uniref:UDENN domain-containing protein n=1 Tax=Achlya hypogyna TaxID=1202772 RepID=A0A1V9Y5A2_ACHHY|nr:hypothetical protein ACHHYP_17055 [Achlya hypogyna]